MMWILQLLQHQQEIKTIFPKTIDVGIEHGTVLVLWEKETMKLQLFEQKVNIGFS